MQKLWPKLVGDASFARAVKKGDGQAVRDALSPEKFCLKPRDIETLAKWLDSNKVAAPACAAVLREVSLQSALGEHVAFNHKPAFEDFFDSASSKGAMESASKTLSATVGHSQAVACLRRIAAKPAIAGRSKAGRVESIAVLEAGRLCLQAASAARHL